MNPSNFQICGVQIWIVPPSSYYTVNPNIGGKKVKKSAVPEIHYKKYVSMFLEWHICARIIYKFKCISL